MDSGDIGLGVNEIGRAVEQSLSAGAKVLEVIITGWKPDWGPDDELDFSSLLAIEGPSAQQAFADTIANELKRMWPMCGDKLVSHLGSEKWKYEETDWSVCLSDDADIVLGLDLLLRWNPKEIRLKAAANTQLTSGKLKEVVVQFVQQMCWLSIVLPASPLGIPARAFVLQHGNGQMRLARATLEFQLLFLPLESEEIKTCWLDLCTNPVLATGFQAPKRKDGYVGLEMSLGFLADLCGARHVVELGGGIVIKGFSAILLPVAYDPDLNIVQWHAVLSDDPETHISYTDGFNRCESRLLTTALHLQTLLREKPRAILGWCKTAQTAFANPSYDPQRITFSKCENEGARTLSRISLEPPTFGISKIVTASTKLKIKGRPNGISYPRQGDLGRILGRASQKPALLFDHDKKRAWLVMCSDAIILMVRRQFDIPTSALNGGDARTTLNKLAKMQGLPTSLEDWISDTWSYMEVLANKLEESLKETSCLSFSPGHYLCGYEFMAIARELTAYPKRTRLSGSHGGWGPLIQNIHALVLFGAEFGDLMHPSALHSPVVCQQWANLPPDCDYMAASVPTILELYEQAGEGSTRGCLNNGNPKLQWDRARSSTIFEPCGQGCSDVCDKRQQIVALSSVKRAPPPDLPCNGAIIFGRGADWTQRLRGKHSIIGCRDNSNPHTPLHHALLPTNGQATEQSDHISESSPDHVMFTMDPAPPASARSTAQGFSEKVLAALASVTESRSSYTQDFGNSGGTVPATHQTLDSTHASNVREDDMEIVISHLQDVVRVSERVLETLVFYNPWSE